MKIAIATEHFEHVAGHAGKAADWLVFDCEPGQPLPDPARIVLEKPQLMHYWKDDGSHPLDGVEIVVAASAGEGFIRHMHKRGAEVLLTGEDDPVAALKCVLAGEVLPDTRFDVTTTLCKLKDLFSRY